MGSLNQHITPTGYRLGGTPVNSNPFWDDGGSESKNITATASVDNTTGTPAVEVTKTETTEAVNFDFAFTGLKGEQGEKGDDGDTPVVSATAVVTDVGSTPSVSVINTGTTEAPNFQFTFDHIGGGGGGETDPAACQVINLHRDQGTINDVGAAIVAAIKACFVRAASSESAFSAFTGTILANLVVHNSTEDDIYIGGLSTASDVTILTNATGFNYDNAIPVNSNDVEPFAQVSGHLPNMQFGDVIVEMSIVKNAVGMNFKVRISIKNVCGFGEIDYPVEVRSKLSVDGVAHYMPGTPAMYSFSISGQPYVYIIDHNCMLSRQYLQDESETFTNMVGADTIAIPYSVSDTTASAAWYDVLAFWSKSTCPTAMLTISINATN